MKKVPKIDRRKEEILPLGIGKLVGGLFFIISQRKQLQFGVKNDRENWKNNFYLFYLIYNCPRFSNFF